MRERYAYELIQKGMRIDERKFDEFRKIKIRYDVSKKAEGSAHVTLGETQVIAGVKLKTGEPYPDTLQEVASFAVRHANFIAAERARRPEAYLQIEAALSRVR